MCAKTGHKFEYLSKHGSSDLVYLECKDCRVLAGVRNPFTRWDPDFCWDDFNETANERYAHVTKATFDDPIKPRRYRCW